MLLGGHDSCSIADCPISFCSCMCHRSNSGMMHCMPCCRTAQCSKCGQTKHQVGADFGQFKGAKDVPASGS